MGPILPPRLGHPQTSAQCTDPSLKNCSTYDVVPLTSRFFFGLLQMIKMAKAYFSSSPSPVTPVACSKVRRKTKHGTSITPGHKASSTHFILSHPCTGSIVVGTGCLALPAPGRSLFLLTVLILGRYVSSSWPGDGGAQE